MQIYNKITDETKLDEIEEYLSFWGRPLRQNAFYNSVEGIFHKCYPKCYPKNYFFGSMHNF